VRGVPLGEVAEARELRPSGGKPGTPGQVLSIDLTGPHPSSNGFKYCLLLQIPITCGAEREVSIPRGAGAGAAVSEARIFTPS
jgi:hypothetical protein